MSLLKSVSDFLFGKEPAIFNDKGQVLHKLPKKKWDDWNDKIIKSRDYNWREHAGHLAGADKTSENPKN